MRGDLPRTMRLTLCAKVRSMNSVEARQKLEVEVRRTAYLLAGSEGHAEIEGATSCRRLRFASLPGHPCRSLRATLASRHRRHHDAGAGHRQGPGSGNRTDPLSAAILSKSPARLYAGKASPPSMRRREMITVAQAGKRSACAGPRHDGLRRPRRSTDTFRPPTTNIPDFTFEPAGGREYGSCRWNRANNEQQLVKAVKTGKEIEYTDLCGVRFVPLLEGIAQE